MKYVYLILSIHLAAMSLADAKPVCWPTSRELYPPSRNLTGVSKTSFDMMLRNFQNKWAPVVKAKGYTLRTVGAWESGTVNAEAWQGWSTWNIRIYGGFARYPGMDYRSLMTVLCHELGHHMGGAPRYYGNTDWASTEGQSDYFSTIHCMKRMGYSGAEIRDASLKLATALARLGGSRTPDPSTTDPSVVRRTDESHPEAQCRLDTMLAGVRCRASGLMSPTDLKVNACHTYPTPTTSSPGSRPRCWFAP